METILVKREAMTVAQVARFLNVDCMKVYQWLWDGKLPGYRYGGSGFWTIYKDDLAKFVADSRTTYRQRGGRRPAAKPPAGEEPKS